MKQYLILIVAFLNFSSYAQEIFEYESRIPTVEKYQSKEISFENALEGIKLSGTLIEPDNEEYQKVIIIVPGSGLDTRHSHYLLSENLLKNNIAVFRYDERGVNKSEGSNSNVSYGVTKITNDLIAAITKIKSNYENSEIKIGLIGHSQGGLSTINAVKTNADIDFLVQWATPVQKYGEFLKYQIRTGVNTFDKELIFDDLEEKIEIISIVQDVISENPGMDDLKLSKELKKVTRKHGYKRKNYDRYTLWTFPSRKDLLRQNNEITYKELKIPMLYIIGSEDIFVDPRTNVGFLESLQNDNIQIIELQELNHFLSKEKMVPNELNMSKTLYEMDQEALDSITNWILER